MSNYPTLFMRNGPLFVRIDVEHVGGPKFKVHLDMPSAPQHSEVREVQTKQGIREVLYDLATKGYAACSEDGTPYRAKRLSKSLTATAAHMVGQGLEIQKILEAFHSVSKLRLSEMCQLVGLIQSTKKDFKETGQVNAKWASPPTLNQAILEAAGL